MHALLVAVDIDSGRADEAVKLLHEFTIPTAQSLAGFVRGTWMRATDGTSGRGVAVFDTEEHARAAASVVQQGPPPGAPVTFRSVDVLEVIAEA
jgi:hypothetical protein